MKGSSCAVPSRNLSRRLLGRGGARPPGEAACSPSHAQWPYTWGRLFRFLSWPLDIVFRLTATRIVVLGQAQLNNLPSPVIFAGTHHSFADLSLLRWGLANSPARRFVRRLIVTVGGPGFPAAGIYGKYATLAFGLFHLGRRGDGRRWLAAAAALARHGNAVLIFPQGQHARPELEREGDPAVSFRRGVAFLAQQMAAPVVPFGVAGTEIMIPPFLDGFRGRVIAGVPVSLRRCPLAIAFGAPLTIGTDESPKEFAARLQQASYALTRCAEQSMVVALQRPPQLADPSTIERNPNIVPESWNQAARRPAASSTRMRGNGTPPISRCE